MTTRSLLLTALLLVAPLSDAAAAGSLNLFSYDTLYGGDVITLRVVPVGLPAGAVVTVLASTAPASGPCSPTGICAGIAAPYRLLDRNAVPARPYSVAASVPVSLNPGQTLYFQAVARAQGVVIAASDVWTAVVQETVFGCTDPAFGTYDPAATHDDGSCACPLEPLVVTSAADLAPHLGCARLGDIDARRWSEPLFALPNLEHAGHISFRSNDVVTRIELPALRTALGIERWSFLAPVEVELGALEQAGVVHLVAATDVRLPALRDVGRLTVKLPASTSLEAPLLVVADELELVDVPYTTWPFPALHELHRLTLGGSIAFDVDLSFEPTSGGVTLFDVVGPTQVRVRGWTSPSTVDYDASLGSTVTDVLLPDATVVGEIFVRSTLPSVHIGLGDAAVDAVDLVAWGVAGMEVALSGVRTVRELAVEYSELAAVRMPDLVAAEELWMANNPSLSELDLPLLTCDGWTGTFVDNPQLCVTAELPLGQAPGTCAAVGTGNQCDP